MQSNTRNEIEDAFEIEQNLASEDWDSVMQQGLFGGRSHWSGGEPNAIKGAATYLLRRIGEKAAKITGRTRDIFENHRDSPSDVEQAEFEQRLEQILKSDIDHVSGRLATIHGFSGPQLIAPRSYLEEKGARDRQRLLQDFRLVWAGARNAQIEAHRQHTGISVIGSNNLLVGNQGASTGDVGNRSEFAPAPTPRRRFGAIKWLLGVAVTIGAGLVVAYIAWRMGWKK